MKKVMVRAWSIAKEAVVKFGGKVKEFFAEALKMAWAEVKEAAKTTKVKCYIPGHRAELEIDTETGFVTGDTYKAKDVLRKKFNGRWIAELKVWKLGTEKNTDGCMSDCEALIKWYAI